jgi:hypothetical protein
MTALQNPAETVVIWDLGYSGYYPGYPVSGAAQIQLSHVSALEWFARDTQARYVEQLPNGTTPGPYVGNKRIIVDSLSDANTGH